MTVKIISWNIGGGTAPWHCLSEMDADVALLQEASEPPQDLFKPVDVDPAPWRTVGWSTWHRRTAIARLSNLVNVEWITTKSLVDVNSGELAVSRLGTLSAAVVTAPSIEPLVVVSMYSFWERPHVSTESGWIISDASAHRLVSDLSTFIGRQSGHRIVAAGDLNILHGHGEYGSKYWAERYGTVFSRMEALGVPFVGPQAPNGRQADPWPDELPRDSKNVQTYATRQLDFVFASTGLAESVSVRALNDPDTWGPSDHCRVEILVS